MKILLCALTTSLLLTACAIPSSRPSGQAAVYRGTIQRVCSPVDASGREIRLEKKSGVGPLLAIIHLWAPLPSASPDPIELTGSERTGSLMVCQSEQDCQLLQRGFILIETENTVGPSTGLFWSPGGQVYGRFSAEPIEGDDLICG